MRSSRALTLEKRQGLQRGPVVALGELERPLGSGNRRRQPCRRVRCLRVAAEAWKQGAYKTAASWVPLQESTANVVGDPC